MSVKLLTLIIVKYFYACSAMQAVAYAQELYIYTEPASVPAKPSVQSLPLITLKK